MPKRKRDPDTTSYEDPVNIEQALFSARKARNDLLLHGDELYHLLHAVKLGEPSVEELRHDMDRALRDWRSARKRVRLSREKPLQEYPR